MAHQARYSSAMQRTTWRVEVGDAGITVTTTTEPFRSMYGREMRPGTTDVWDVPWDEITSVSISATEHPPDFTRELVLVVDLTWGEYLELHEDADGFDEALAALARRSGTPVPDRDAVPTFEHLDIWTRETRSTTNQGDEI